MAKIIQASDFCLGRQFAGIGKSGDFVRKALKESLENAITLALDRSVDLFLVTGNLFAGNMVSLHLADFAMRQIERLGKTPFVVVPGARDCLKEDSIYRFLTAEGSPENFHLVDGRLVPYLTLTDSGVTIYGIGCHDDGARRGELPTPIGTDLQTINIAAISDYESPEILGDASSMDALIASLTRAGFNYIAVGGPEYKRWSDIAFSSGAPEQQDFADTASGNLLVVDVGSETPEIEQVHTGQLIWHNIVLDNSRFRYGIELEEELLKYASPQTLLRIQFNGDFVVDGYVDLQALENEFGSQFCCLRLEDARNFDQDRLRVAGNGGDNLLTDYTYLLEDAIDKATPDLKPRYLQALATGCAMLSGKDVIS